MDNSTLSAGQFGGIGGTSGTNNGGSSSALNGPLGSSGMVGQGAGVGIGSAAY